MWIFKTVFFWNIILHFNKVYSQSLSEITGSVDIHAKIGTIPQKYPVLDSDDQTASQKITTLVEMMRPAFPTGFGPMPPLDPYTKKHFEPITFNAPNLWFSGKAYLKDLKVIGAQHFSLQGFQMRVKNSRSDASITVPRLVAEVDFEVRATLGFLPIVFGGHLRVVLTGVSVSAAVGAEKTMSGNRLVFQLTTADVKAHAENIQIMVTNFHLGDGLEELDGDFSFIKWINELKNDIGLAVVRATINEINSSLKNFTVDQVMGFLLS